MTTQTVTLNLPIGRVQRRNQLAMRYRARLQAARVSPVVVTRPAPTTSTRWADTFVGGVLLLCFLLLPFAAGAVVGPKGNSGPPVPVFKKGAVVAGLHAPFKVGDPVAPAVVARSLVKWGQP